MDRQELRERIRQSIEDAVAAEQQAGVIAAQAPPAPPGFPGRPVTIATTGVPPWDPNDMPQRVQETAIAFFIMVAVIFIGFPIARAFARRIDRAPGSNKLPAEVSTQLAQLNQSVDAIAVEVERISEGQRFTTKLLSEQHRLPAVSSRDS